MEYVALSGYLLFLALAFGAKTITQVRGTGDSGFRGVSGRPGSREWFAGRLFVIALLVGVLAPILAAAGVVEPVPALDTRSLHLAGGVAFLVGLGLTLLAQVQMGLSWRIGVDEAEKTELVQTGLFALVRNPVFSAMGIVTVGLVLLVPSPVAFLGLGALLIALELQVRVVEEPYLLRVQGQAYAAYAARVGRFIPGIGRISSG